jgi:hypothetical protein
VARISHTTQHDPTIHHDRCDVCNAALRLTFTKLADLHLGPKDADALISVIRREAIGMRVVA